MPSGEHMTTLHHINSIVCGNNTDILSTFDSGSVDCVVTSPPYDNLRAYNGYNMDLHHLGEELYRVMRSGSICALVIQDATLNGAKSLTSFRTVLDWCDNIGFRLFESVIYKKQGVEGAWWKKRFRVDHEYIFLLLKGDRPAFFDKEPLKIKSKHGGKTIVGGAVRMKNGSTIKSRPIIINAMKCRGTIWDYTTCGDGSKLKHKHPATFPNKLPYDIIECFCPAGGLVLDPFSGSGTTCVAAKSLGRMYVGIDVSEEYCEIARTRIQQECLVGTVQDCGKAYIGSSH